MTEKSAADRVLELEQNYEWFIPTEYITRPILDSAQMDELAALAPALARQVKGLEGNLKTVMRHKEELLRANAELERRASIAEEKVSSMRQKK